MARLMEFLESVNATFENGERLECDRTNFYYSPGSATRKYWSRILFENDVPEWVITHAAEDHYLNWDSIIKAIATRTFFRSKHGMLTPTLNMSADQLCNLADEILNKVAAIVVVGEFGPKGPVRGGLKTEPLIRSLEHDGYSVDTKNVRLIPIEGHVSHEEEESRLETLLSQSGLPNIHIAKKHLTDAAEQYVDGTKDHSSLGESRTLLQSLIDVISGQIQNTGKSAAGLPAGTANRLDYLEKNGLLTADEKAAFGAAWGFLSAGNHPGLPPREQARIGLLLSIEFTQVLVMKWLDWRKRNGV